MLFDRLDVKRPTAQGGNTILVIGGAGGVGSITIQLLRALTDLTVIVTASRPETQDWVRECGAHHVIDHRQPLAPQVEALGLGAPGFVFSTTQTDAHFSDIVELIAPQGRFGLIDDPAELSALPLKRKAVSLHWELMFTRSLFDTPDMAEQGKLLNEVAALVDAGKSVQPLPKSPVRSMPRPCALYMRRSKEVPHVARSYLKDFKTLRLSRIVAMQIEKLDHVNLRTTQLDSMIDWYSNVLGMRSGDRPDFPFSGDSIQIKI
jgi:NADPH:quinone reductase-like Zn-dependent oxidoreductase